MARKSSRGATRNPVRKQRQSVAWKSLFSQLFMLTVLAGLIAGGVYIQRDDTLPILHVTVEGDFVHVDKNTLVKAVMPHVTGNFINVDVTKLRESGEGLPWVKVIQVKRIWPDSLNLIVEEHTAIAQWGQTALINQQGELFSPAKATYPTGLAMIDGPEGANKMMTQRYRVLNKTFATLGLDLQQVSMDPRRAWTMQFDNGMTIRLGRADNAQRLQRFLRVYKAGLNSYQSAIAVVDMRYTNGLAVQWKPEQKPDFNGAV